MILGLLGLDKIFGGSKRAELNRDIDRYNALNQQADGQRVSIDDSNRRQAEIEMLKAGAQSSRTNTSLDAWQSIMGTGTKSEDYTQKYMQGQLNRDFEDKNKVLLTYGIIAFVGIFAIGLMVMLFKK